MPLDHKFIFTADLHLKLWTDKEYTDTGLPVKLMEILHTFDQMCEYAVTNGIDTIVIGGDLNDTKGVVAVRAFLLFRQIIEKYMDRLYFYIVHGNHDATTGRVEEEESAIQLLEPCNNVTIIMKPTRIGHILFVPHSKNINDVISSEYEKGLDPVTVLVSHFGLNEGCLSSGISIRTGITINDLRPFKKVFLGHYHKPQMISNDETTLYYVGSPIAIRRDESGEEKRFIVIDSERMTEESILTTGWRRYVELVLDEETDLEEFAYALNKAKEDGHHIIVKKKIANVPKEVASMVESHAQLVDIYEAEEELRGITTGMTIEEQMRKLLEIENIPEDERSEYLEIGMEAISHEGENYD
jgi:DNA repair exonuclease SbcCD nuclease subunit